MAFYNELKTLIDANVSAIYIETTEWKRCEAEIENCKESKEVKYWNPLTGLDNNDEDFIELIRTIKSKDDNYWDITVIAYADRYFKDDDPTIMFGALLRKLKHLKHQVIIISPKLTLPSAIKNEFAIIDFPLPDREDIKKILNATQLDESKIDTANEILDAVKGLGTTEIFNAFAKVAVNNQKITAEEIPQLIAEKEQIIRKSGYLEFIHTNIKPENIGGLELLKKWLEDRKIAFSAKAKEYKLETPKGVLLLGIPGTGKSLTAKAIASIWKMPLLRLDMGRIFGGLVGESESNMRNTIKVAESLEPCVLWIDEIEKGLSGGSGGEQDGGTSTRVFGSFLTWMQEKQKAVFIFATANDVSKLPPELLRKGRFDEIFFVDLPNEDIRKKVFEIHLKNKDQAIEPSDELIKKTEGFSGAEIESIVNESLFMAYNEKDSNKPIISAKHLIDSVKLIVPLSQTMTENIEQLRGWANKRCRPASEGEAPKIPSLEEDTPRLLQEEHNIFIKK